MNAIRNQVQLIGHVGSTPEIKSFENGKTMAKFSLATNKIIRNDKGVKETKTQWHNLVVWGKQSSIVERYVHKGSEVAVNGSINSRIYLDKDGNSRQTTEIVVRDMQILGKRKSA